jgi:hypothetical protein
MRTKLILTTAALGVASSLGAWAQVYSVNAVGYINVTVPAGKFQIVANQLNTGGNTVAEVIPTTSDGVILYKYAQGSGYSINAYDAGWGTPTQVIKPGESFFVSNPTTADVTFTFVGEVPQGNLSTPLVQGLNLVASQVPQAGALSGALGYTAADGDQVYKYVPASGAYEIYSFDAGWGPSDPNIAVGEGFFLSKLGAGSWNRTFSVNP